MTACPDLEALDRFRHADLDPELTTSLEHHLESCPECRERLAELGEHDAMLGALRVAWSGSGTGGAVAGPDDAGIRIPGYEIVRVLDAGGQGIVCEARQLSTRRPVAIKLLRAGRFATDRQRLRFEREIDLVAGLDHPGIVTIFDSGRTDDGRDYLVMRHVEGVSLDRYLVDDGRSIAATVTLFMKVADAVRHAHLRGIIHRDLKPSNILVDANGDPHLLDFGVARTRGGSRGSAQAVHTRTGEFVGTLAYAAPEQVCGSPDEIDVRTDVYALGAVFYEMLTGRMPYAVGGELAETIRNIETATPVQPSAVRPEIDADLETIVLEMLAKEKERRYQSAVALLRDLERYRRGEAIEARADSTWYVLRKTVRRHRVPVLAAATAGLVLLAATAVSVEFWRRAERDRGEAVAAGRKASEALARVTLEAGKLTATNEFLLRMLDSIHPAGSGQVVPVLAVLDDATQEIAISFAEQPLAEADVRLAIGNAYRALGQFEAGRTHIDRAVAIRRDSLGADHLETLAARAAHVVMLTHEGHFEDAEREAQAVLDERTEQLGQDHRETLASMDSLALVFQHQGRFDQVEPLWRRSLALRRSAFGVEDIGTLQAMSSVAWLCLEQGRYDEAEELSEEAFTTGQRVLGRDNSITCRAAIILGLAYQRQGRYQEAEALHAETLAIQERTLGADHPDVLLSLSNLSWLLSQLGRNDEAAALAERGLETCRRVLGPEHRGTLQIMNDLAVIRGRQGRSDEQATLLHETLTLRRRTLGPEHPDTVGSMNNLGAMYYEHDRLDETDGLWTEVLAIRQRVRGPEHPLTLEAMHNLALLRDRQGRLDEAGELYRTVLEKRRVVLGPDHRQTFRSLNDLAALEARQERYEEAEALFAEGVAIALRAWPDEHPQLAGRRQVHAECFLHQERWEEAEAELLEARRLLEAALGPDHPDTQRIAARLVALRGAHGRGGAALIVVEDVAPRGPDAVP